MERLIDYCDDGKTCHFPQFHLKSIFSIFKGRQNYESTLLKKNEVFYQKKSGIWKKSVNVKKIAKEMSKSGKCFY